MLRRILPALLVAAVVATAAPTPALADHQALQASVVTQRPITAYAAAGEQVLMKMGNERTVVLHDLKSGQQRVLTTEAAGNPALAFDGVHAVYQTTRDGFEPFQLVLHNLATDQKRVVHSGREIQRAFLGEGKVLFTEVWTPAYEVSLYTYEIASRAKKQALILSTNKVEAYSLQTDGRLVVWTDPLTGWGPRNHQQGVGAYDLQTGRWYSNAHSAQVILGVSDGKALIARAVYDAEFQRTGTSALLWEPAAMRERLVTTLSLDASYPLLDAGRIAWTLPTARGSHDLILHDLAGSPGRVPGAAHAGLPPQRGGGRALRRCPSLPLGPRADPSGPGPGAGDRLCEPLQPRRRDHPGGDGGAAPAGAGASRGSLPLWGPDRRLRMGRPGCGCAHRPRPALGLPRRLLRTGAPGLPGAGGGDSLPSLPRLAPRKLLAGAEPAVRFKRLSMECVVERTTIPCENELTNWRSSAPWPPSRW